MLCAKNYCTLLIFGRVIFKIERGVILRHSGFSLLTVTNARSSPYVTLIKPTSSLKVTHRFFRHASLHLWNQLLTLLRIPYPNYSSSSQRPSFEHAGLTCYTLLSPSITFYHFFTVSLGAQNLPFQKILSSTLVCFCLSD